MKALKDSGREMAKVLISKDWAKTALGPIEGWPQSLRTTVSLCLASNFPISIAWGPDRVQIYNDGYRPFCGVKHPESMGQDFKECWFSAWPAIGEAFERAQQGESSFLENQRMFLDRSGYLEETFFTFSFSPIQDETGGVGGLFHPVTETTDRMLSERRTRALRDLAVETATATTIEEVCAAAAGILGDGNLDLPFGLIYLSENGKMEAGEEPAASFGADAEVLALFEKIHRQWPLGMALETGQPQMVADLDFGPLPCGPYPEPPHKALVIPIPKLGVNKWAGVLVVGLSSRLPFDEPYRGFCDLVTSYIATALANAWSAEEERRKAEALTELDRAKTAFFSNVSHEFRTPLTLMLGPLEDLLDRPEIRSGPAGNDLDLAHRNGLRLLKLVNTLLDFSRLESGQAQPVFRATDLGTFTTELASVFRSAVERANLELQVECPPGDEPVYIDRDMWEKIVLNLLSNAYKFTLQGKITVRLTHAADSVELTVEDTGGGIEQKALAQIFNRFHRVAGAPSRTHEGTGIGLALVKELVLLHGGSVKVDSVPGQGSCFSVTLPRDAGHLPPDQIVRHIGDGGDYGASVAQARPYVTEANRWLVEIPDQPDAPLSLAIPEAASAGAVRDRVLIADDNSDMAEYLRRALSNLYEVHVASDGLQALAFARKFRFDLVLTDVMMPRMDGFELLREMRSDSRTKSIPIILLSARAGEEARVEGLEAGADDYLIKPFTLRELLARVDVHLRMAKIRDEAATAVALQEANDRYFQMIETANDAFVSMDANGCVLAWNRQAELTFGWSRDEAMGRTVAELIVPMGLRAEHAAALELFVQSGRSQIARRCIELPAVTRTGEALTVELTVWPVRSRGVLTFSSFIRDIRQRRQTETELKAAKQAAESANRAKSEFLSSMSHEIRTPMNAILGIAELLSESRLDAEQTQYVDVFRRAGSNLLAIINNVLDLSKIESGHFELEKISFNPAEAIERSIELAAVKANEKGLTLISRIGSGVPRNLIGDPTRLQQILINLLGNALKFTEAGEVVLSVDCHLSGNPGHLQMSVSDTGIGIAPEKVGLIFDDFTQADTSITRKQSGTGLGLGICRRLLGCMGGGITVESSLGTGSIFRFDAQFEVGAGPPVRMEIKDLHGRRVLVLESDPINRVIYRETLTAWGLPSDEFATAREGLAYFAEAVRRGEPPALIILESRLPDMDGYEAAKRFHIAEPGIPLALLSSDSRPGAAARCREAGFASFATKPVNRTDLLRLVCDALGKTMEQPPGVPSPESASSGLRILIAEDSSDNRMLLRAYLRNTPYEVTFAEDGMRAVEQFQNSMYDLVLMDMQMPVLDGLGATRLIRDVEQTRGQAPTPILALTASALAHDFDASMKAGCTAHLSKPISKQKLLAEIERYGTPVPA